MSDNLQTKIQQENLTNKALQELYKPIIKDASLLNIIEALKEIPVANKIGYFTETAYRYVLQNTEMADTIKNNALFRFANTLALYYKLFPKEVREKVAKELEAKLTGDAKGTIFGDEIAKASVNGAVAPTPLTIEGATKNIKNIKTINMVDRTSVKILIKKDKEKYVTYGHLTDEGVSFNVSNKYTQAGGGIFGKLLDTVVNSVVAFKLFERGKLKDVVNVIRNNGKNSNNKDNSNNTNINTDINNVTKISREANGSIIKTIPESNNTGVIASYFIKSPVIYKGTEPLSVTIKMNLVAYKNVDLISKTIDILSNSIPNLNNSLVQGVMPPKITITLYNRLILKDLLIEKVNTSFHPPFVGSGSRLTPVVIPLTITARTPFIVDGSMVKDMLIRRK